MRAAHGLILALTLIAGDAAPSAAQSVDESDLYGARVDATLLYGGHGPDFEMFSDSQALKRVRFRAALVSESAASSDVLNLRIVEASGPPDVWTLRTWSHSVEPRTLEPSKRCHDAPPHPI